MDPLDVLIDAVNIALFLDFLNIFTIIYQLLNLQKE